MCLWKGSTTVKCHLHSLQLQYVNMWQEREFTDVTFCNVCCYEDDICCNSHVDLTEWLWSFSLTTNHNHRSKFCLSLWYLNLFRRVWAHPCLFVLTWPLKAFLQHARHSLFSIQTLFDYFEHFSMWPTTELCLESVSKCNDCVYLQRQDEEWRSSSEIFFFWHSQEIKWRWHFRVLSQRASCREILAALSCKIICN